MPNDNKKTKNKTKKIKEKVEEKSSELENEVKKTASKMSSDSSNTADEITNLKKEIETLNQFPISKDELDLAKNHLLGSIQLEMANPFSTFDKIKSIRLNQLGEEYYKNLFSEIKSTNSERLQSVAQKYFSANNLLEVTVG